MTAQALERAFPTQGRGENRDEILLNFRVSLRALTNPSTGAVFTEREIATATGTLTRWYAEADAIDLVLLSDQQRDLYLADQLRIDRSSALWLVLYHGDLWGETPESAAKGSGPATATATVGETFVGSTTLPDGAAAQATDPAGLTYQVLFNATANGSGVATLSLSAIDGGNATNLASGTVLKWSANKPLGASESFTTTASFTGGADAETSAQFASRLLDRIRHKPASGNNAHMRAWARASSASVENAFVYACAMQAGSTVVCVTQKRGSSQGPTARIPSIGTLTAATSYLTPPVSPVVPVPPLVLLVPPVGQSSNLALLLDMPRAQASGYADPVPWPSVGTATNFWTKIKTVTNQTNVKITRGLGSASLPAGVTAPSLMVWNAGTSRFEVLLVTSVTLDAGDDFDVVLSQAPTTTLAVGQFISPEAGLHAVIAETVELYFDSLGPGELVNLASDTRAHRAFRFPQPSEDFPQVAGSAVTGWLTDALGSTLANVNLKQISSDTPSVPASVTTGPSLMVAGHVGIYPP